MSRQLSGKYILIGQFSKGTLCAKVQEITQQMFLNSKFGEVWSMETSARGTLGSELPQKFLIRKGPYRRKCSRVVYS